MECNILKQNVAANSIVFNKSAEYIIDSDFVLPDYYPEISKILKCRVVPFVATSIISGQTLAVDGSAAVNIIYISGSGEMGCFEQSIPFSKNFELDEAVSDYYVNATAKCAYANCRAVTERKIALHGAIGICAKVTAKELNEIIQDVDSPDVVLNRGVAPATTPIGTAEKSMLIEEELELGAGQPSATYILRSEAKPTVKECKIIGGKVVAKGEMSVYILYCSDSSKNPQAFKSIIPFSQILDIKDLNENCKCSCTVELAMLDIKPRTSAGGEIRNFSLTAKLRFCAAASCENDIPVLLNAYSTKYKSEITKNDICFNKVVKSVNDDLVCKKSINLPVNDVGQISDIICDISVKSNKIEDGTLNISGILQVGILLFDSAGSPAFCEDSAEFSYTLPLGLSGNLTAEPTVIADPVSYTISAGNTIEISAVIKINATVCECTKIPVITNIKLDFESRKERANANALVLYFAEAGEPIWDIAERYNSTPEEIAEINELNGNKVDAPATLLIPIK